MGPPKVIELEVGAGVCASLAELVRRHGDEPAALTFGSLQPGLMVAFTRADGLVSTYLLNGDGTIHVPNPDATALDDEWPDWLPEADLERGAG